MKYKTKKIRTLPVVNNAPHCVLLLLAFVVVCFFSSAAAEDWPTYMHDNARSGVTSDTLLMDELNENWVYISPAPPQVAWDGGAPWDA